MNFEQSPMKEDLSEDERRALRGSKFAPLPTSPLTSSIISQPRQAPRSSLLSFFSRLAHPGGAMKTNKAAALAKFLERKLHQPGGLDSIDPDLLQLAVDNAKETLHISTHGGASSSGRIVRHVSSFGDSSEESGEDQDKMEEIKLKKKKKKRKERKRKKKKEMTKGPKCRKITKMNKIKP
ncbi:uncharacterized protein M6B38_115450 [Iris pallida]|uniref:Uncharacterized protein n=1 Tax=Iris pallida TaxID=29817 RepID=A0AAX6I3K1_IRIPA|nr:uncharacterized protein M6B38_115450 [Iris pallida]